MEKILRIEAGDFEIKKAGDLYSAFYEGYEIVTDQQTIKIGIATGQSCCESYGYLSTNDNVKDFEGCDLLSLAIVDMDLKHTEIKELKSLDMGGTMFVNVETTNGLLQLVAYNGHNGWYGHEAVVVSKQLNYSDTL